MGASESMLSNPRRVGDEITTVSERSQDLDPLLERLKSLTITTPILNSMPAESSLTDILMGKKIEVQSEGNRKQWIMRNGFTLGTLNPKVLLELFSMYQDWQEEKTQKISKEQEEIENEIEVADALAIKLRQRFNYLVSAMKTTSHHLSQVHVLQVEIGELKGRLTEVISNCDALCKRIAADGPETLQTSIKPFAAATSDLGTSSRTSSLSRGPDARLQITETKPN